ncbi:MAG TPA: hypothetical protein VJ808_00555 [Gemmatimonadales bacterium]|nr:hypothetical protein [Gemmatimonadales bacterium]
MLAIHSAGRRAYWRMLRQWRCRGAMERKIAGTPAAHRNIRLAGRTHLLGDLQPDRTTGLVLANDRKAYVIAV